ncbi:MAG: glutathione S-transferase domain-containing protein [Bradyrhizobium sp.]
MGHLSEQSEYQRGLKAAPRVLGALDQLANGGNFLVSDALSLADIHLAPMIAYFVADPGGDALLKSHDRLCSWWSAVSQRKSVAETRPTLPSTVAQ